MPEVEEQLREYWTSVTAAQPPPMAADLMESAPITERHSDPDDGSSRFTARRQLLAAAAAVLLVAGVVTVYALVSGDGDDDPTVTTDAPPAPEGRETEEVDDPEPVTSEQVDEGIDDPDYQASASMEVLPRYEFGVNTHSLRGQITLSSVALILDTAETRAEIEAAGFSPDYTVTVDDKDPRMLVKVSDRDPVIAQATVDELIIRVRAELDALQTAVNAPQSELLDIQVLHTSPPP